MQSVNFEGSEISEYFESLLKNLKNKNRILKDAFSKFAYPDIMDHFHNEEGPQGSWPRRNERTQKAYDRIARGFRKAPKGTKRSDYSSTNKLLQLTGALERSINPRAILVRGDSVEVSSMVPYGNTHNQGNKTFNIPKREFLWLSQKSIDGILGFVLEQIK
jgi:phage gpG-like protein